MVLDTKSRPERYMEQRRPHCTTNLHLQRMGCVEQSRNKSDMALLGWVEKKTFIRHELNVIGNCAKQLMRSRRLVGRPCTSLRLCESKRTSLKHLGRALEHNDAGKLAALLCWPCPGSSIECGRRLTGKQGHKSIKQQAKQQVMYRYSQRRRESKKLGLSPAWSPRLALYACGSFMYVPSTQRRRRHGWTLFWHTNDGANGSRLGTCVRRKNAECRCRLLLVRISLYVIDSSSGYVIRWAPKIISAGASHCRSPCMCGVQSLRPVK
jgi:hypothetical protein